MIARPYCGRGHAMTGDNVIHRSGHRGGRDCRECNRIRALWTYHATKPTLLATLRQEAVELASGHRLGTWYVDSPGCSVASCDDCGALVAIDGKSREINGRATTQPCQAWVAA